MFRRLLCRWSGETVLSPLATLSSLGLGRPVREEVRPSWDHTFWGNKTLFSQLKSISPSTICRQLRAFVLLASPGLFAFLIACGGGGGGPPSKVASPPLQYSEALIPSINENNAFWQSNTEYLSSQGLPLINAARAYSQGVTGAGQIIGFIDTGLALNHAEFSDQPGRPAKIAFYDTSGFGGPPTAGALSHGTAVASIAAGNHGTGERMQGVAFDAQIAMWAVGENQDLSLELNSDVLSRAYDALIAHDVKIINNSWGMDEVYDPYLAQEQTQIVSNLYGANLNDISEGQAVFVHAAGNRGQNEVTITSALPLYFPSLTGRTIAVTSVGLDGVIDTLANRCGAAAAFCVAAPGGYSPNYGFVVAASSSGGYRAVRGTSFATAYVSGVLALMRQRFGDQLSAAQYISRLLATARKTGDYARTEIYGQGLVDASAALAPVGTLSIPIASGTLQPVFSQSVTKGRFRIFPQTMLAADMIMLDEMGAPFTVKIGALMTADTPDLPELPDANAFITDNQLDALPGYPDLYFSRASQGVDFLRAMSFSSSVRGRGDQLSFISQLHLNSREEEKTLAMGVVVHQDGLGKLSGQSLLSGRGSGQTFFIDITKRFSFADEWRAMMKLHVAKAHYTPKSSLADHIKVDFSSQLTVEAEKGRSKFLLRRDSPVESGLVSLQLPQRRNPDGSIVFTTERYQLNRADQWLLRFSHQTGPRAWLFTQLDKQFDRSELTLGLSAQF